MSDLVYWHWLALGFVLLILEMFVPTFFLLWIGLGALVTGAVTWIMPGIGWEWQMIIFVIFSLISIFLWRKYRQPKDEQEDGATKLHKRNDHLIGKVYPLYRAIDHGVGSIKVDDTFWQVEGPDLPEGVMVEIIETQSMTLLVKAADE